MASPLLPASLLPSPSTPHSTTVASTTLLPPTTTTTTTAGSPPLHPLHPPSPSAVAAATTLTALSSSRPPTSHGEDENTLDDLDHDDSGGISLADLQHFVEASPAPYPVEDPTEDAIGQLQSASAHFPFWQSTVQTSAFDIYDPVMSSFLPSTASLISNSEHSLAPPTPLQEAHLSILDKASFVSIDVFGRSLLGTDLECIKQPPWITREMLNGDRYDYQGIDWTAQGYERRYVRMRRREFERAKLLKVRGNVPTGDGKPYNDDNYFQFRRNNTNHHAFFPHFQLRNVLAATSRNDVFYAAGHRVLRTDAQGTAADTVIDLSKRLASDGSITTIAAKDNVLIAGAFEGEYAITDLASTYGSPCTFGRTTDFAPDTKSKIVNHLHIFESHATYTPQAVLCSNDYRLRVLDCGTNTFTHSFLYPAAVNCSATSPNGRMRVVVGDFRETLITNAETGQPFQTLRAHTDDAFACAWADDGIHIATAAQDNRVVVWDARYWREPLASFTSELSVPRSLRFSPIGSGPRHLMVAEADDYLTFHNAQTFERKQVFDFFGPIGGATFTPDGQSIFMANADPKFGGIIELDRTGWAEHSRPRESWPVPRPSHMPMDWVDEDELDDYEQVAGGYTQRERRHLRLRGLIV